MILLRNLNQDKGLCNGTKLRVLHCHSRVLHCEILTGDKKYIGKNCFIPRIDLSASETDFPFHFVRRQFPVKLAFACTINKVRNVEIIKMFDFIQKD